MIFDIDRDLNIMFIIQVTIVTHIFEVNYETRSSYLTYLGIIL